MQLRGRIDERDIGICLLERRAQVAEKRRFRQAISVGRPLQGRRVDIDHRRDFLPGLLRQRPQH